MPGEEQKKGESRFVQRCGSVETCRKAHGSLLFMGKTGTRRLNRHEQHRMATVQLKNIKKVYPYISGEQKKSKKKADDAPKKKINLQITDEGVVAVQQFSLDIADKEFIVLVGPSGCGKSTTLRMVAGLEEITDGELLIDGKLVNDIPPKDRDIARVFQNYALYHHMTVYENMAFSL